MSRAGVLDSEATTPKFPNWFEVAATLDKPQAEDILTAMEEKTFIVMSEQQLVLWRTYERQLDAVLEIASTNPKRVPGFKFASQEGWVVNESECRTIASALQSYLKSTDIRPEGFDIDIVNDLLEEWIAFNELAALHDGYTIS